MTVYNNDFPWHMAKCTNNNNMAFTIYNNITSSYSE